MKKNYSKQLSKRLGQYGSLAVALTGLSEANSQVIYTDVNPDYSGSLGSSYAIDFDNDGVDDITLNNSNGSASYYGGIFTIDYALLYASPEGSNAVLGSTTNSYNYPFALNSGNTISSNAGTFLNNTSLNIMNFNSTFYYYGYPLSSRSMGNWVGVNDKYLGVKFDISGQTHYGWIRLDVNGDSSFTVKDFAYETNPNTLIIAGDQIGSLPCAAPTALNIDNFNEDSVNFSWTASPDETDGYNWAVFAAGADIANDTPIATGNVLTGILNASANGLSPDTPYDIYVQTKCSSNNFSNWEGPQTFTTVAVPCATPTALSIDSFNEDSVNFSWTASPDETNGYNWAVFAAGADITNDTPIAIGNVATGIINASANGLSPDTPYDVYVQTNCALNTSSDWEGPQTFTTVAVPCATPTALSIDSFNEDSVNFSWTASPDETNGYHWAIFAAGADITNDTPIATGNVTTGIINASANGLSPETPYDVYVQTNCALNTSSDWEGPQNFTTDAIPCAAPTALSIDSFNDNSVDFSWTASPDETDGYQWAVFATGADITNDTPIATGNVATGILNASSTGLDPEIPYDIYVKTKCISQSSSDWEGPQTFTTDPIPCAAPTALTIGTVTENSVAFSWTASPDETDGYNWAVFAMGADITNDTPIAIGNVATGTLNASATGLDPETPYDVYIQTKCTSETSSDWEGPQTFTTDPIPCAAPTALIIDTVTENSVTFSWTASPDETDGYHWAVFATGADITNDTPIATGNVATGTLNASATGLNPETPYDVYIQTKCTSETSSDWEGPQTFTTKNLSTRNFESLNDVSFYPNPVSSILTIESKSRITALEIYNLLGQKVYHSQVNKINPELDMSILEKGTYFIKIYKDKISKNFKIIKE